jgi:hypothetical protein
VNAWKVIFATIVIFGAGVFSGGLLVNYVDHSHQGNHRPPSAPSPPREPVDLAPRPEVLKTNFVQRLDEVLNLTHDQQAQIEVIVADGQLRNRDLWQQIAPQVRAVAQDTRLRIRAVLTDDQKGQFEQLLRRARRPGATNAPPGMPSTEATNTGAN